MFAVRRRSFLDEYVCPSASAPTPTLGRAAVMLLGCERAYCAASPRLRPPPILQNWERRHRCFSRGQLCATPSAYVYLSA